jgi:hypothetical protein
MTAGRLAAIAILVAPACGHVGYDAVGDGGDSIDTPGDDDAPAGLLPIHEYHFRGNYDDDYGGPPMVGHGGTFVAGGYQFAANAGLSVDGAMPPSVYTVDLVFSFDQITSWRKILDYKELATDEGFYTFDDHIQYVVVAGSDFANGTTPVTAGTTMQVTITRDAAGTVTGYLNLGQEFTFTDGADVATLAAAEAHFFIDDTATGMGEASGGTVRRIRIYDVAVPQADLQP